MTETEKQQIISLVLQALKTNSLTIEQLTDTTELSKDMYVEVSGGRKISIDLLSSTIAKMVNGDFDALVENVNKIAKDLSDGDAELLKRITGVSDKSNPLTDPFKSIGSFTTIGSFKDKLKTMYSGDSSIGNYRCILSVDSSKIPVNIQIERLGLDKVCQSFTSCIQLATMSENAEGVYLGTVCTISRIGIVSGGSVTWDKWTSVISDFEERIGKANGIAPLNDEGKLLEANLPDSLGNLKTLLENIPDVILPESLTANALSTELQIEFQVKDKINGEIKDKQFSLPMVSYQGAGIMSAEDKAALDKLKNSGGGGSGSGFYDVTKQHPLEDAFYTLATAVAAVSSAEIPNEQKPGMIITFEISSGKWEDYRFSGTDISTFLTPASWERHGGGDAIKGVSVNGETLFPDETGKVNLEIEQQETDATLDEESTNAIQNAPVAAKFNEIEANTVFTLDSEVDEDNNTVKLSLKNKSGAEIASTEFHGGTGGGSGETGTATKIVLNASVDNSIIKEGGSSILTWFYDHQYTTGDDKGMSTGQKATLTIQMLRGAQTVYTETINDVSKGTYTLDLSKYLLLGTTDIYVKATTADPEGKKQTKQAYTSVKVITLSLSSTYNIASPVGGYAAGATASIPFTISGTGNKVVMLYVDGVQKDSKTITKSGQTNSSFSISMSDLLPGRHTVQMVAEMEASADLTIRSESIYLDIFKEGSSVPCIGMMHRFPDGRIFTDAHLTPRLEVGQYEKLQFEFVVYDPGKTPAEMSVSCNGVKTQTVSVSRTVQVYTNRFTGQGEYEMRFSCGNTEYDFLVDVAKSSIDIEEVQADLDLKLSAAGRSNTEENPAVWTDGEVTTEFTGFDWNSNGWTGDSLLLSNGAAIEIMKQPFSDDAVSNGGTYEFELKCSNITDRKGVVVSCMSGGIGFQMTAQEAVVAASGGSSVDTPFASGMNYKIAFVIGKKSGNRLMELYVNGIRCGAKQYAQTESMKQESPVNITVSSDAADVELRNLRIYRRGLTDDEELTNYMVDRPTSDEMVMLFRKNDVMNDDGSDVDIEKLRTRGKSVMRIVGDVNLVNATNNKKFEVVADVYFYSKYGKEYDFILRKAGLRIQGTSSTTYPRKNYRIYFFRSEKYGTTLEVGGVDVPDLMYSFKPGAKRVGIFCLKADFSDSSSTHNTGAVRLINDVWKKCGWLTPPQTVDSSVRIGVDGDPIDCFYDNDDTGVNIYLGKYNFNNEKSESHDVYGFEGIAGFNDPEALNGQRNKCICVEFLNNSHPLCLFGTANITEEEFSEGLEFRFKADKTWADADEEDKAAVQRLWSWIYSCKGNHVKFLNEYKDYFGNDSPFAWYLITDYLMAVDNRAKNMMLATWDGRIWYFLPYDLDTILGGRNDSVLKYDYTITHESFDESIGSYAFAGHDSVLWDLVRGCPEKLREVAGILRSNMSTEDVLDMFNNQMMGNWCERIYNKDGEYKYIKPLTDGVTTSEGTKYYDYLYALQGSRYAHRTYTIQNRFALLDSQYLAGTYRQDSFPVYFGYKFSTDKRKVRITASERYYFGYGYTSGEPKQSGILAEDTGSVVELTLDIDLIVNDPQYFYGASRMLGLDLTNVSHAIVGILNLNNCIALRTLDISCAATQRTMTALLIDKCRNLCELNLTGLQSPDFISMDLSSNSKLEIFRAGKSALTGVSFAPGSPLSVAVLPATLQTLELRYLNKLSNDNLTLEGTNNINRMVVDNCALIDWQELLAACPVVKYLRVTGIDMEGDGPFLRGFMSMGGVDENGGNVQTCRLVGTYRLTRSISEEEYAEAIIHFPELTIIQPEWTCIEADDTEANDANISNLDNMTGYKYGTPYAPSGHILRILSKRHRVLSKQTDEGMFYCQLHDEDSRYYADHANVANCTPALIDGSEGDLDVYEPHYWTKGVNDILGVLAGDGISRKWSFYSSNEDMPSTPNNYQKVTYKELLEGGYVVDNKYVDIGGKTSNEYLKAGGGYYNAIYLDVDRGYKRVRIPISPRVDNSSSTYQRIGGLFFNAAGEIIGNVYMLGDISGSGMYAIVNIPEDAKTLLFTVTVYVVDDMPDIIFSNSDNPADWEPKWVEHDEYLCNALKNINVDGKHLSAVKSDNSIAATQLDYVTIGKLVAVRKRIHADYDMYNDIANLFLAKYGRRDSQRIFGYSIDINKSGYTLPYSMRDTFVIDDFTVTGAYQVTGKNPVTGADIIGNIKAINSLGYENLFMGQNEYVDGLYMSTSTFVHRIIRLNGRSISAQRLYTYVRNVAHGLHMDQLSVSENGSNEAGTDTHYCDYYQVYANRAMKSTTGKGAGLFNFNNYSGGIYGFTIRQAYRGKLVRLTDVTQFKNIKNFY